MKIEGIENILTMFSVFHDGSISACTQDNSTLEFDVEIEYLAERISPSFKALHVTLFEASNLSFTTWPDDADAKPDTFTDMMAIFTPELEILSAEIVEDLIQVACNQPLPDLGYCGGYLKLKAASALVTDEAGKECSLEVLCSLSDGYWDEWENKNRA